MTARRPSGLGAKGHRRYGLATSDAATVRKARLCVAQWAAEHSLSIREARELLDMITPLPEDVK